MTATQLQIAALAIISEASADARQYDDGVTVGQINRLIAHAFDANNALLKVAGKPELDEPPFIEKMGDEINYNWRLTSAAFPWGLASFLVLDDDEMAKVNYFNMMYNQFLRTASVAVAEKIKDVYGGCEE